MTIDVEAIRKLCDGIAAESEDEWQYIDGPLLSDVHIQTQPKNPGRSRIRVDPGAIGPFIAAARTLVPQLLAAYEQACAERDSAQREADRLRHGMPIEGDFVCPDSLERNQLRALLAKADEECVILTGEVMSLASQREALREECDALKAENRELFRDLLLSIARSAQTRAV